MEKGGHIHKYFYLWPFVAVDAMDRPKQSPQIKVSSQSGWEDGPVISHPPREHPKESITNLYDQIGMRFPVTCVLTSDQYSI